MLRECKLEDISDGKLYDVNDMVKCDTNGCRGCNKCCTNVGSSIVLTPYDVFQLKKTTAFSFNDLLNHGFIEMNIVDGLILPNIKMNDKNSCSFLDDEGWCKVHENRPDICKLFPLGRYYNGDEYKYFLQKDECPSKLKTKIKVKQWIGTESAEHKEYVIKWHNLIKKLGDYFIEARNNGRVEKLNDIAMYILNEFYVNDYGEDYISYIDLINKVSQNLINMGIFIK